MPTLDIEYNELFSLTPYQHRLSILNINNFDYSGAILDLNLLQSRLTRGLKTVLTSTALQSADLLNFCQAQQINNNLSIQVSFGAEFDQNQGRILDLCELGVQIDLLIDRPLMTENLMNTLDKFKDKEVRLCVIVNKYFAVEQIIKSLETAKIFNIFILILPKTVENSPYYNSDEVITILNRLEHANAQYIVYKNIIQILKANFDKELYISLNTKSYLTQKNNYKEFYFLKKSLFWAAQKKAIYLLDFIFLLAQFFFKPSRKSFASALSLIFSVFSDLKWRISNFVKYSVYGNLKWKIFNFFRYSLRHIVVNYLFLPLYLFLRFKLIHFLHYTIYDNLKFRLSMFFRYTVFTFIKYKIPSILRYIAIVIRYKIIPFLTYPVLKVYWFVKFQIEKRILKKHTKETQ